MEADAHGLKKGLKVAFFNLPQHREVGLKPLAD
jgi:hypothetical protein